MLKCKYCSSPLDKHQDNDRIANNLYSKIYPCINKSCGAVYEEWTTEKGIPIPEKNRWFNPKTKEWDYD